MHFIWISDSCHSEDLSRKHEIIESKDAFEDTRFRRFNYNESTQHAESIALVASLGSAPVPLHGALLSGCASHQLSADA